MPFTFLRDPWNWLDFTVIVMAYVTVFCVFVIVTPAAVIDEFTFKARDLCAPTLLLVAD